MEILLPTSTASTASATNTASTTKDAVVAENLFDTFDNEERAVTVLKEKPGAPVDGLPIEGVQNTNNLLSLNNITGINIQLHNLRDIPSIVTHGKHALYGKSHRLRPRNFFIGSCYLCGTARHLHALCPLRMCNVCFRFGHSSSMCRSDD